MTIIDILRLDDWENVSPIVEIAKGANEYPNTWKKGKKQLKRLIRYGRN